MSIAKIHLSPEEALLINNTEWILTKHSILKKVYQMFGEINEMIRKEMEAHNYLFKNIQSINGKISRGENYQNLPYIILDHPAYFKNNNVFAVRTMFWWGNFFSVTLHLSGDNKISFFKNNPHVFSLLKKHDFFICTNKDEWQHYFEEDNYTSAVSLTDEGFDKITKKPFFKAAKKITLSEWDNASTFIIQTFKNILELLQFNFPGDKKDLLPEFPKAGSDL